MMFLIKGVNFDCLTLTSSALLKHALLNFNIVCLFSADWRGYSRHKQLGKKMSCKKYFHVSPYPRPDCLLTKTGVVLVRKNIATEPAMADDLGFCKLQ